MEDNEINMTLYEQAFKRGDVEGMVSALVELIFVHILKCLIFGHVNTPLVHWIDELDKWFLKIRTKRVKPNSKPIKNEDIIKWGFESLISNNGLIDTQNYNNYIISAVRNIKDLQQVGRDLITQNRDAVLELYKKLLLSCAEEQTYTQDFLIDILYEWFDSHSEIYNID